MTRKRHKPGNPLVFERWPHGDPKLVPIIDLPLSVRTLNRLTVERYWAHRDLMPMVAGDLERLRPAQLLKLRGFGRVSLREVVAWLEVNGMSLAPGLFDVRDQIVGKIVTPDWIAAHCESLSGGWFHPIELSWAHPLVVEGWKCIACDGLFVLQDVAFVMPFHGGPDHGGDRWIAEHRECVAAAMFEAPATRAGLRPPDYSLFMPERQREIDKRLGLLDWDGK